MSDRCFNLCVKIRVESSTNRVALLGLLGKGTAVCVDVCVHLCANGVARRQLCVTMFVYICVGMCVSWRRVDACVDLSENLSNLSSKKNPDTDF